MPREVIVIQVGQCGNQIGCRLWELLLQEHLASAAPAIAGPVKVTGTAGGGGTTATEGGGSEGARGGEAAATAIPAPMGEIKAAPAEGEAEAAPAAAEAMSQPSVAACHFDDAMSSFFIPASSRANLRDPCAAHAGLKARAVLVDMEEGVLRQLLRGPLGGLFDTTQLIADVSGAGNNWSKGFAFYGPKYRQQLCDSIRRAIEQADSPQAFLLLHSLGGGTGSGVGTYILEMLATEFAGASRFCCCISPSPHQDDDVITAPYNSILSLLLLKEHASCVLPVANDSLIRLATKQEKKEAPQQQQQKTGGGWDPNNMNKKNNKKKKAFDGMNDIVAQMLSDLTSSVRFDGSLNVDIGDLTTNMVPFPGLHFLSAATAALPKAATPAPSSGSAGPSAVSRHLERLVAETLSPQQQLLPGCPSRSLCLASTFLVRGTSGLSVSDVLLGIKKAKTNLSFIDFAEDATKIGICRVPPLQQRYGLLSLLNSCEVRHFFQNIHSRFIKLYRRKAHLHHYEEHIECSIFDAAAENVISLYEDYAYFNSHSAPPPSYFSAASSLSHKLAATQSTLHDGVRTPANFARTKSHGSDNGDACLNTATRLNSLGSTTWASGNSSNSRSSSSSICHTRRGSTLGTNGVAAGNSGSSNSPCMLQRKTCVQFGARERVAYNAHGAATVTPITTATAAAVSDFRLRRSRPLL